MEQRNDLGYIALMCAALANQFMCAELLLNMGANPNTQDSMGGTSIMFATCAGHSPIVDLLIQKESKFGAKRR